MMKIIHNIKLEDYIILKIITSGRLFMVVQHVQVLVLLVLQDKSLVLVRGGLWDAFLVLLQLPLVLRAAVLEPDFDLEEKRGFLLRI